MASPFFIFYQVLYLYSYIWRIYILILTYYNSCDEYFPVQKGDPYDM